MTCCIAWTDKTGGHIVSDRRIVTDGGTLTSDRQSKVWSSGDRALTVAYAGDVGVAQAFLRKLAESGELLASLPGGEQPSFSFLAYDAVGHKLYLGDSTSFLVVRHDLTAIGSGGHFALGYIAGTGKKVTPDAAKRAVRACSKVDLSVSATSDVTHIKRIRASSRDA